MIAIARLLQTTLTDEIKKEEIKKKKKKEMKYKYFKRAIAIKQAKKRASSFCARENETVKIFVVERK